MMRLPPIARKPAGASGAVIAAGALLLLLLPRPGSGSGLPITTDSPDPVGRFVTVCKFSHASRDDPIVFPGQRGAAHLHHFFGNRTTDAFSTARRLRSVERGTCHLRRDRSAYWVPALMIDGHAVVPEKLFAYYSSRGREPASIKPMPRGLKMLAGDSHASERQHRGITQWSCVPPKSTLPSPVPMGYAVSHPHCRGNERLALSVSFRDCWDGRRLDSRDHMSHLAYSLQRSDAYQQCPQSHPVPIPALGLRFHYPTSGAAGDIELSSGGVHSAHADFFNGWVQPAMRRLVRECIQRAHDCARFGR